MAYLKPDVLLLADVFENFRKYCMDYYKLDSANYLYAPSLARDAMLLTNIDLKLISGLKMLDMVGKPQKVIKEREVEVEKVVEKPVVVEKIVEKPTTKVISGNDLLDRIFFSK